MMMRATRIMGIRVTISCRYYIAFEVMLFFLVDNQIPVAAPESSFLSTIFPLSIARINVNVSTPFSRSKVEFLSSKESLIPALSLEFDCQQELYCRILTFAVVRGQ